MPPNDTLTLSSKLEHVWEKGSGNNPTEHFCSSQIFVTIKYYIQIQNKPGVKQVSAGILLPWKLSERYVNVQGAGVLCWLHKLVTVFTIELSRMPLFNFKHASVRLPYTARLNLTLECKCWTRGLGRSDLSYFPRCPSFIEHFCLQSLQVLSVPWELHFDSSKNKSPRVWLGICVTFCSCPKAPLFVILLPPGHGRVTPTPRSVHLCSPHTWEGFCSQLPLLSQAHRPCNLHTEMLRDFQGRRRGIWMNR